MPAPNAVRELFRRLGRERAPYSSIHERIEAYTDFTPPPSVAADNDPASFTQALNRLQQGVNYDIELSGTNAATTDATLDVDGGSTITTAGADNDQCILFPTAGINSIEISRFNAVNWTPTKESHFECLIRLPVITSILVHVGFKLTGVLDLTTDADAAFLQFSTEGAVSTTLWTANTSIAGTDVEAVTTSAAVAVTRNYRILIRLTSAQKPIFFVNGTKVFTGPTALTAGGALKPCIGWQALTGTGRVVNARWLRTSCLHEANA